jgi:hypothetical protein
MTALHCSDCDRTDCQGFERRATPEPAPALRPTRVATAAQRAAALEQIRAELAAARAKETGR